MRTMAKSAIIVFTLGLLSPAFSVYSAEQVYGWQLMSEQERNEHRTKMQNMKTEEERERYRIEHHNMMQERAKLKGVTLPEMPLHSGKGMGSGSGSGTGSGGGGGKGR